MGLLDNIDTEAWLGLSAGLLNAGGPSRTPTSTGQALAQGYQGWQQAKSAQQERAQRQQLIDMQKMQMETYKQTQADSQKTREAMAQFRTTLPAEYQNLPDTLLMPMLAKQFAPEEDYTLAPGGARFRGKQKIAELPPEVKTPPVPSAIQEYQFAVGQGFNGTFEQWDTARKRAGATTVSVGAPVSGVDPATGNPAFGSPKKDGSGFVITPGLVPTPKEDKPLTESQAKAAVFRQQMQSAEYQYQKAGVISPTAAAIAEKVPMLGSVAAQQSNQAREQWAESFLRFKTGAAATEQEKKDNIAMFFPRIGETDEKIIEQKRLMREKAIEDLAMADGSANPKLPGVPAGAIAELKLRKNDPKAKQQFDAVFGAGAADKALGGG